MASDYDAVVAFAFGAPADLWSNQEIGIRTVFASRGRIPVVTQRDVPLTSDPDLMPPLPSEIYIVDENEEDFAISTLCLAKRLRGLALKHGWRRVLVVAATPHDRRCLRDVRRMGLDAKLDTYFRKAQADGQDLRSVWYCRDSVQCRTRSPFFWWPREIIVRFLPWWLYQRVAA